MGSVNGTIKDVVDELRDRGVAIGAIDLCTFRPFPSAAMRAALKGARNVVVVEKNLALGMGGVLASHVRMALRGEPTRVFTVVAGLGGRAITRASLSRAFEQAREGTLDELCMLDLDWRVVEQEIARTDQTRRSGATASNVLRDVGPGMRRIA
jgi:pyruvate ferredoxin oxidoreductase alpha subunit